MHQKNATCKNLHTFIAKIAFFPFSKKAKYKTGKISHIKLQYTFCVFPKLLNFAHKKKLDMNKKCNVLGKIYNSLAIWIFIFGIR